MQEPGLAWPLRTYGEKCRKGKASGRKASRPRIKKTSYSTLNFRKSRNNFLKCNTSITYES